MSRWYRAYEGTCSDAKLAEAALVADCTRAVAIAAWHLTLENAATVNDGGRIDIPTRRIAAALCEPFATIETLFAQFEAIGLVADSCVTAWKRRQYESDTSTERVRKHRKIKRGETGNGDETFQAAPVTPPETKTEVPLADANGRKPPSAIDFKKAVFDSGKAILKAAGHDDRQAGSMLGRWRNDLRNDATMMTILADCEANDISDPIPWITAAVEREKRHGKPTTRHDEHQNAYVRAALARRETERAGSEFG